MIHRSFWLRSSRMQLVWVYGFQLDNEALISSIVCTYIVWALQKQWTADCNWIFWRMWCAMRKRKTQGEKAVVEPTHVESKRPDRSLQSLLTLACRIGFAGGRGHGYWWSGVSILWWYQKGRNMHDARQHTLVTLVYLLVQPRRRR